MTKNKDSGLAEFVHRTKNSTVMDTHTTLVYNGVAGYYEGCYTARMISLTDIIKASNGQLFGEAVSHLFTDFCFDSREAKESQLFVAMRTDRGDSHQYIEEAIENGVDGIICTSPPDCDTDNVTVIVVKDPLSALMNWVQMMLTRINATVIAVAGSSARSTSAEAVCRVLSKTHQVYYRDVDVPGRLGIAIGSGGGLA